VRVDFSRGFLQFGHEVEVYAVKYPDYESEKYQGESYCAAELDD
jgi:hypothetical protein